MGWALVSGWWAICIVHQLFVYSITTFLIIIILILFNFNYYIFFNLSPWVSLPFLLQFPHPSPRVEGKMRRLREWLCSVWIGTYAVVFNLLYFPWWCIFIQMVFGHLCEHFPQDSEDCIPCGGWNKQCIIYQTCRVPEIHGIWNATSLNTGS